ncbi:MAG: virulence RhuM family protein [Prevotella sp.]|nr:virulence RhuM family protein [Prevotella sp.]
MSQHQKGIYADGELDEKATHKKYLLVRQEGKRLVQREIDQYNLDMIIALGYRVQSPIAVRFRRWVTQRQNLLTSQFLDYAEFQALEQNPMTMADWIAALDDQILRLRKNILEGNGIVSHQEAIEKAEREFEIYREREMRLLESDFDKAVKMLKENHDDKGDS